MKKIYKNYKELCEDLGWSVARGNSKNKQLKELDLMCEWHKDGHKIIIDKEFEEKKTELSHGLLKGDIELLILDMLSKAEGRHISLTMKKLLRALELVNDNYINGWNNKGEFLKLHELTNVDSDTIGDVFYLINSKGVRNVRNALNDLQNKCLILWELRMMVCVTEEIKRNESGDVMFDENDEPIIEKMYHRFPTESERATILDIEKHVMDEMGVKNKMFFNINKEARDKFRNRCKSELEGSGIEYYYYAYDIVYNSEQINKALNRSDLAKVKDRLNGNMLNQVNKSIDKEVEENKQREDIMELIELGLYDDKKLVSNKSRNNYEKDAKKVAKKVIDRKIQKRDKIVG